MKNFEITVSGSGTKEEILEALSDLIKSIKETELCQDNHVDCFECDILVAHIDEL